MLHIYIYIYIYIYDISHLRVNSAFKGLRKKRLVLEINVGFLVTFIKYIEVTRTRSDRQFVGSAGICKLRVCLSTFCGDSR